MFGDASLDARPLSDVRKPLLICFSHLRWSFVWQRPQQLMSRFAASHRVVFVEEPVSAADDAPSMLGRRETDGVTVLTPILDRHRFGHGFGDHVNPAIRALVSDWLQRNPAGPDAIVWYWTPLALGACPESLASAVVVFDAMDELSAFRFAAPDLARKEADLMTWADLVFTGGPSLFRARQARHPRVSCFPSGVDAAHYRQAVEIRTDADPDALHLGYVGVLDERIDLDLIAAIADARPSWAISLVGPLAKITPEDLPSRPNIVHHGLQPYEALPGIMATFDIGILPFGLNEATRFISPTKTLEYLAAGLPVISTPVHDVAELYGDCVALAADAEGFVRAAGAMSTESPRERAARMDRAATHLRQNDWDTIVASMQARIDQIRRPALAIRAVSSITEPMASTAI